MEELKKKLNAKIEKLTKQIQDGVDNKKFAESKISEADEVIHKINYPKTGEEEKEFFQAKGKKLVYEEYKKELDENIDGFLEERMFYRRMLRELEIL